MFSENKDRLYIAYYLRGTALLLAPKKPSFMVNDTTRYHVFDTVLRSGKVVWQYEEKPVVSRTDKLAAVMLLGKLPPSWNKGAISNWLRTVPLAQYNMPVAVPPVAATVTVATAVPGVQYPVATAVPVAPAVPGVQYQVATAVPVASAVPGVQYPVATAVPVASAVPGVQYPVATAVPTVATAVPMAPAVPGVQYTVAPAVPAAPAVSEVQYNMSHHWLWAAIDVRDDTDSLGVTSLTRSKTLVRAGALQGIYENGHDLWDRGSAYAEPYRLGILDLRYPLPTFDTAGNSIISEFPVVQS